jgi:hypothetical protein
MNKSRRKKGKHDRQKRKELVSKEGISGSECHMPNDLVSGLEHEEANSDTGRITRYFTLNCVPFIHLDTFKRRFRLRYTSTK